jgi:hypothetical protein
VTEDESAGKQANLSLVLGYLAIKELKTLEERVGVLARLGYANREIAQICDTTALSVSVRKASLKKGKGSRQRTLKNK